MEQAWVYRFGRFLLDARRHTLVKDGEQVHLTPKAFDVLVELLSAGGGVVSKTELINKVWANSCVEESNLSQSIWMLRRALEDGTEDGARRYISTIWGRGYKIVADVTRSESLERTTLHAGALTASQRNGGQRGELTVGPLAHLQNDEAPYSAYAREPKSAIRPAPGPSGAISKLTPTERRVLQRIAGNRTSRQIADELGISGRTVDNHRARIRTKLGISGSNSLLKFALEHRWEILAAAGQC